MPSPVIIPVSEDILFLKRAIKVGSSSFRCRIKMLLLIHSGVHNNTSLAHKAGSGVRSIVRWKQIYLLGGYEALIADNRGGDRKSNIDSATKQRIKEKLSEAQCAFTSYKQAQEWISEELQIDKQYHAVYQYLRRNFGTKLKVGRKSHIKKDESAVAVFKNATKDPRIYKK